LIEELTYAIDVWFQEKILTNDAPRLDLKPRLLGHICLVVSFLKAITLPYLRLIRSPDPIQIDTQMYFTDIEPATSWVHASVQPTPPNRPLSLPVIVVTLVYNKVNYKTLRASLKGIGEGITLLETIYRFTNSFRDSVREYFLSFIQTFEFIFYTNYRLYLLYKLSALAFTSDPPRLRGCNANIKVIIYYIMHITLSIIKTASKSVG
jgi:hypothetical protein